MVQEVEFGSIKPLWANPELYELGLTASCDVGQSDSKPSKSGV